MYSKANKSLGYIKRNTRFVKSTEARRMFYLALVRSHFGYATQIWAPQSIELINHLERTQRRATKYILNLPFSSDIDYKSRLQSLHLLPICYWHEYLDLILFFKITHGLLKTSASPVIQSSRRTTRSNPSNTVKYVIPRCKTTSYQKSFLVRTSRIWNTLIDAIDLHTDSLAVFKSCLLNYYFTSVDITYNPENPRTFRSLCLKNKGEFRSRPISAFVYMFALSQSECVKRFITLNLLTNVWGYFRAFLQMVFCVFAMKLIYVVLKIILLNFLVAIFD
jgi:hypothetical protein